MQKTNLIFYFKQLSKRDWREFRKFVRSPYYNQREDVVLLFDYIDGALADVKPEILDRERVFEVVYPHLAFDDKKLRQVNSCLLQILKRYLAQAEWEADGVSVKQYLCESLRKKGLESFFEKELSNARSLLAKEPFEDRDFYFQKYKIGIEDIVFTSQRKSEETNFHAIVAPLNIFYISEILRLACAMQSNKTISGQDQELKFLPQILAFLETGEYLEEPVVGLYYFSYKAQEELDKGNTVASEKNFQQLKNGINENWQLLPPAEIRDLYLVAINYCIKRLNTGDREFIREAFELFRSALKNKTLLEKGFFSSFTYKNITRLGMALAENEWVEQFLENYKRHLHPRERENTWRYNLAFFYFQQEKYRSAMQLLVQVDFKDVLNNLDARRMLLKSYFELGEYDALDSLLDSFSRYLQRQKEMGYHRENYFNLIRFVKRIIHRKGKEKETLSHLQEEIKTVTHLAEREWLLEKTFE